MAYISTYDERYYGGYLSSNAGARDAPNYLNDTYVLAENSIGYGTLVSNNFISDQDIYSLGLLQAGTYKLDVDGTNWDFSNFYFGGVNSFGVLDSYGYELVNGSYSEFSDIYFTLLQPQTVYAYVNGNSYSTTEYSVSYSYIPPVDSPPVYDIRMNLTNDVGGDGFWHVGDTLTYAGMTSDADGIYASEYSIYLYDQNSNVYEQIFFSSDNSYVLQKDDVGKIFEVRISTIDLLGNSYYEVFNFGSNSINSNLSQEYSYPISLISENDIVSRKAELGLNNKEWNEVSSLFPNDFGLFYKWGEGIGTAPQLSYSFTNPGSINFDTSYTDEIDINWGSGSSSGFENFTLANPLTGFSEAEKEFVREALRGYSDASGITFVEVSDNNFDSYGEIRFFSLDFETYKQINPDLFDAGGFAFLPYSPNGGSASVLSGDLFLRSDYELFDGYSEHVIVHEIGHALGLSHPFEGYNIIGNSDDSLDNSLTNLTYDIQPLYLGINPMPIDIKALEFIYGGNDKRNLDDDIYILDERLFNATNYGGYADARFSIMDDGGTDNIDASNMKNGIFINLAPGSWSVLDNNSAIFSTFDSSNSDYQKVSKFSSNILIQNETPALINDFGQVFIDDQSFIETCELTSYDDIIFDNSSSNIIRCHAGNDLVSVSFGNDKIYGGGGNDEVSIFGLVDDYSIIKAGNGFELENNNTSSANFGQKLYLEDIEKVSFYEDDSSISYQNSITSFFNEYSYVNFAPELQDISAQDSYQGNAFEYQLNASDENGDFLTYSSVSVPSWISISSSGLISGTPANEHVGTHEVTVKVTDSAGLSDEKTFTLTVNNVNDPPLFNFTPPTSTDEDAVFSYQLTASDIDADVVEETLTYEPISLPSWMNVSSSGLISGTPANGDVGAHEVTVKVTDSAGASDEKTFTLTVKNVNDAPVLEQGTLPNILQENEAIRYQFMASDDDIKFGDQLVYSQYNLPNWLDLSNDGLLTGTPTNSDYGNHNFSIIVTDQHGASDQKNYNLQVKQNEPPKIISSQENVVINEGDQFSYWIEVNDIETNASDLIFEFSKPLPEWLKFDEARNWLYGSTGPYSPGDYEIEFSVKDDGGLSDSQYFTVEILNVNNAPYLPSNLDRTIGEDSSFEWRPVVLDQDLPISGPDRWSQQWFLGGLEWHQDSKISDELLTFSSNNLPDWLRMDPSMGTLTGTPEQKDIGVHEFTQIVTDKSGAFYEKTYKLTVENTNDTPVLEAISDTSAEEDAAFSYQLTANDIDADVVEETLTYQVVSAPSWMNVSSSGLITGTPANEDVGSHEVTVKVTDSAGASDEKTFTLTVNNVNDVPVLEAISDTSAEEDAAFSYQLTANDIDADVVEETLTYEVVSAPSWMTMSSSGLMTGTPTNDDVGSHEVTVKVTDSSGSSDEKTFTLTVNNVNDAPIIEVRDGDGALADAIDESAFSHQLGVTDVDVGDSHIFRMTSNEDISWLSLDAATGLLTGAPDDEQVGVYNITFSVEDAAGVVSTSDAISLTVQNINDPVYIDDVQTSMFRSNTENIYQIKIIDEDLADSYSFTANNLPSWMSLDASTGVLSGSPTRADDGSYNVEVTVTDSGGLSDTKVIEITATSFEYSVLGSGDDMVFGDADRDHISTGGGNDKVYSGANDDVVVVQGQGDVEVDTGAGDDRVVVEQDWSGTLFVKNGAGNNVLEIQSSIKDVNIDANGNLLVSLEDGSEIESIGYLSIDETTGKYQVTEEGFSSIIFNNFIPTEEPYEFGFGDIRNALVRGSDTTDDILFASNYDSAPDDETHHIVSARDGNDEIFAGGGLNSLYGGHGEDLFHVSSEAQQTVIVGDEEVSRQVGGGSNVDTSISFSTDLGLLGSSSQPSLYLKYAVEGSSDAPRVSKKYFNEFKHPDYINISLDDSRGSKEASYNSESNEATSTYDVSYHLNDGLYASATNVTVSKASLYEVLASADSGPVMGGEYTIREILYHSQDLEQWPSVSVSGTNNTWDLFRNKTEAEIQSIYENNIQIDNLPGGKPSWEQLKSLFDQAQSKISIDDGDITFNSAGGSDTSISFSTDLGLLGSSSQPSLYLKYAVEGSSDAPRVSKKYFNEFKHPDYINISLDDSRGSKEASYNSESNEATSTYDVSYHLNDGLYASATNVTVSKASLYEVLASADSGPVMGGEYTIREILYHSQDLEQWPSVSVSGTNNTWDLFRNKTEAEIQSIYENNIQIDNLPGGKPSWEQLKSLFDQAQSKISIDDGDITFNSAGGSDTSISFSTDLGLLGSSSQPSLYLKYAVEGSSDAPRVSKKYFNEFKHPDYINISLDDSRGSKEASYNSESNEATSTYDVSYHLNDGLYASATNVTVSKASLYEVLASADSGPVMGGEYTIREILYHSQDLEQWPSVSVSGTNNTWDLFRNKTEAEIQSIYENNIQIDNLPGGKPSWEQLKSLFDQAQSKISIDDGNITFNSAKAVYSGQMPTVQTQNSSYSDVVEIDWSYYDSEISSIAGGYRIYNEDLAATVDIYDIEVLKFKDANVSGGWDIRYLTDGQVIGTNEWHGDFAGTEIDYEGDNVSFVVDGDTLKVMADVTITTSVEQFGERVYWTNPRYPGVSWDESVYNYNFDTHRVFGGGDGVRHTEEISLGFVDETTKTSGIIWEGERSQVDAFEFAGGITVNVINVADKDWNDKPIETVIGTDGIDLIFGNASDNLIDGGLGDDIIFGGGGDDVIIGGEGDDIIAGGAGDDVIRGDTVTDQDAALSYFAALTNFDDSQLSIDNSGMGTGGDDVIMGGDGIDDIDSGEGSNFVTSGRMDLDGDGEADLDMVKDFMEDNNIDNKDIFDNDDWV